MNGKWNKNRPQRLLDNIKWKYRTDRRKFGMSQNRCYKIHDKIPKKRQGNRNKMVFHQ